MTPGGEKGGEKGFDKGGGKGGEKGGGKGYGMDRMGGPDADRGSRDQGVGENTPFPCPLTGAMIDRQNFLEHYEKATRTLPSQNSSRLLSLFVCWIVEILHVPRQCRAV